MYVYISRWTARSWRRRCCCWRRGRALAPRVRGDRQAAAAHSVSAARQRTAAAGKNSASTPPAPGAQSAPDACPDLIKRRRTSALMLVEDCPPGRSSSGIAYALIPPAQAVLGAACVGGEVCGARRRRWFKNHSNPHPKKHKNKNKSQRNSPWPRSELPATSRQRRCGSPPARSRGDPQQEPGRGSRGCGAGPASGALAVPELGLERKDSQ